ncbi:hypothetical protein B0H14DRAFT_3157332 [Mycena olivaceomarginata]|nr:hypothetical protein B0H14DRAFT_3157332 [Mycena olivaceomarginata]
MVYGAINEDLKQGYITEEVCELLGVSRSSLYGSTAGRPISPVGPKPKSSNAWLSIKVGKCARKSRSVKSFSETAVIKSIVTANNATRQWLVSQPPPPSVLRTSRDIGRVLEPSLAIVLLGYVAAGEEGGTVTSWTDWTRMSPVLVMVALPAISEGTTLKKWVSPPNHENLASESLG